MMRVLPVVATLATMSLSLNRSIKFSPHHIPHMAISRTKKIIGGVVIILAAGAVFCYYKPELTRKYLPADLCNILRIPRTMPGSYIQSILTAEDWTNPEQATAKLTKLIDERLQSTDPEAVAQFISEPQNRLLLADANMLTSAELILISSKRNMTSSCKMYRPAPSHLLSSRTLTACVCSA